MPHKTKYKTPLPRYAEAYEVSLSTVKRWAEKGYPLDDPQELAKVIYRQKNKPERYNGRLGPKQPAAPVRAGKRDVSPQVFAALVSGQRGAVRFLRWKRRLMTTLARELPEQKQELLFVADFALSMIAREIHCLIFDMSRAAAGVPLADITEKRRADDADFNDPNDTGEDEE